MTSTRTNARNYAMHRRGGAVACRSHPRTFTGNRVGFISPTLTSVRRPACQAAKRPSLYRAGCGSITAGSSVCPCQHRFAVAGAGDKRPAVAVGRVEASGHVVAEDRDARGVAAVAHRQRCCTAFNAGPLAHIPAGFSRGDRSAADRLSFRLRPPLADEFLRFGTAARLQGFLPEGCFVDEVKDPRFAFKAAVSCLHS